MLRRALGAAALALVLLAGPAAAAAAAEDEQAQAALDQGERYRRLLAEAWGPEPPDRLEKFLACREALKAVYERYPDGITQWALREASTRQTLTQSLMGVFQMRKTLEAELQRTGLTQDDYQRLTMLVYGRWLRAVRPDPPPEARVLRMLQEYDVGIARRLANNPPEDAKERNRLEERLVLVRWQARYIAPFAVADKAEVLGKIDRRTAEWLEAHRARVESLDFGVFDTAAPPRPGPPAGPPRHAAPQEQP